ncbi:unnamed protein product [Arctogadus glacialis]
MLILSSSVAKWYRIILSGPTQQKPGTLRYPEIQIQVSEAPSGLRRLPLTEDLWLTPGTTTPSTPNDQNPIAILLATPRLCSEGNLPALEQGTRAAVERGARSYKAFKDDPDSNAANLCSTGTMSSAPESGGSGGLSLSSAALCGHALILQSLTLPDPHLVLQTLLWYYRPPLVLQTILWYYRPLSGTTDPLWCAERAHRLRDVQDLKDDGSPPVRQSAARGSGGDGASVVCIRPPMLTFNPSDESVVRPRSQHRRACGARRHPLRSKRSARPQRSTPQGRRLSADKINKRWVSRRHQNNPELNLAKHTLSTTPDRRETPGNPVSSPALLLLGARRGTRLVPALPQTLLLLILSKDNGRSPETTSTSHVFPLFKRTASSCRLVIRDVCSQREGPSDALRTYMKPPGPWPRHPKPPDVTLGRGALCSPCGSEPGDW